MWLAIVLSSLGFVFAMVLVALEAEEEEKGSFRGAGGTAAASRVVVLRLFAAGGKRLVGGKRRTTSFRLSATKAWNIIRMRKVTENTRHEFFIKVAAILLAIVSCQ